MIKKLKRRFIILAMVSLTILLAVIVAGMNIISYEKVVSDADTRLDVLEENSEFLLSRPDDMDDGKGPFGDRDDKDDFFGPGGPGGPSMTKDEAEEARFFIVTVDAEGNISRTDTERISAVDSDEAAEYAEKALASGKDKGFVGEFRYSVSESGEETRITFLDCGRVMESFRAFLQASVTMSLAGLLIVFAVICYFAERIVRPVAESHEKQKRFITDAGHEIRTPLAIIKANLDLMEMQLDNVESAHGRSAETDELRDGVSEIDGQVDRLTELTNDLVYLSRMEEDESSLVLADVPLSEITGAAVSAFAALAKEQGRTLTADIEEDVTVRGSTKELEKLLSIVLDNAVKYSGDGQPIEVTLKKEGRNALVEVRNTVDSELTNETLAHVFERFYRTDTSRNSQTGGHGIGLSMAQAIVSAHGGRINARTSDGHDFIVTAALPLV